MATLRDTRALVDGAFMAGLTAVLALLGMYIPPFFFVSSMLLPIPLAVLVRRQNLKVAILSLVVTLFLMTVLYPDPLVVLIMFMQFGPLGLVLGLLYKNYVSAGHALVAASLVATLSSLAVIALSVMVVGISLEALQASLNESMNKAFAMYQEAGIPVPLEQQQMLREGVQTAVLLLPAAYIAAYLISTTLTYIIGAKVLRRLNYQVNSLPPFSKWRLPWYAIWGIIIGLLCYLLGNEYQLDTVKIIGQNVLILFVFIFFIFGLSVIVHFYQQINLAKPFKMMLLFLLIIYISFMYMAVVLLGLLDTIFNLRRPITKKEI
ncbi:YybS family protein [Desulforamulus ferrireducens]|uniref:Membrane-like protein n=1 Tax=Desulforamulus ferrireducens TaxID=1833852 RepID=A0A1S6ISI8_9FIRM|nr:YybS family protein [Desulforamulus ferrireducens]AQS57738.1 membrane-like protein [Desulforamulus ferrireducens]